MYNLIDGVTGGFGYKLATEADIELSIFKEQGEEVYYFDNVPMMSVATKGYNYVRLVIVPKTADKPVGIIMTPKEAKKCAKILKKLSKKARRNNNE